jgi:L-iditol 2-dehydrogenase
VCETLHSTTFDPGGFSEFVRLPRINVERGTFHLPDDVSFEEGSFVEPLACVVRAQRLAGLRPGDSVAVLGAGLSGILHILLARAVGASRVFATDVSDYRVKAAIGFGADLALKADGDVVGQMRAANDGQLVDRVLVCTAARPAFDQALQLVDGGGSILFFAPLTPGERVPLEMFDLWKRGISIVHSYAGPPADMHAALELIASRRVSVGSLVSHRLGLAETQEGFRLTAEAQDSLKVIIDPGR